jgi:protein CrcB
VDAVRDGVMQGDYGWWKHIIRCTMSSMKRSMRRAVCDVWRLLIVTGMLGGFTSFSTFSYETYGLLVSGSWLEAGINIVGSVGLAMIGVFLGAGLARLLP